MDDNNSQNLKIAVVYYCYNRIDHTKKSLPKIFEYKKDLPLYIYCDGSKGGNGIEIFAVRKYIEETTLNKEGVKVIFRNENLGLAPNVIKGVNEVFMDEFDAVIALEDDCVPKKDFFNFMVTALNFYKCHENVMHVSGFGLPLKNKPVEDYYITPYPCSWGWGTWKKHWKECDFEDIGLYNHILNESSLKNQFNWAGKSFSSFLTLQLNGQVNSWLIRWYVHIFKTKGVCIWATNSKLENIGFDGTGEHKVNFDRFNQKTVKEKNSFEFKSDIKFNLNTINEFRLFFMGPKIIDKVKTVIYLYTGIIIDKITDRSNYYK